MYNRAIFRTLAYVKLDASSKACRTCKMIMHLQSPTIVRSLFEHFQGYLGIFTDIDAYSATPTDAQLLPVLNIKKSTLIWERKALIVSIFELKFLLKM